MLYANDAGVVSASPRGLARIMDVIVIAYQEFGSTVSEKTEGMHLWSGSSTASNALRIEAPGQRYKQTIEFLYLGGAISESADLDTEIKHSIGAAWASVGRYSSQLYDRRNVRLSIKIRLFKAEIVVTCVVPGTDVPRGLCVLRILAACVPPISYFYASSSFGARIVSYTNILSHGETLERTGSERIETTIRKRQLGFAGTLIRQGDSRLSKRVMFGRLAVQGPTRGGRPATPWGDCLNKNSRPSGRTRANAKDAYGSYSELLSRMDGIG